MKKQLIGEFPKDPRRILKVHIEGGKTHLDEKDNKPYVDIRLWSPGSLHDHTPPPNPLHFGIRLNPEQLPKLIQILQKAQKALKE